MTTQKIDQKIVPFLWFDKNAEEAVKFYTSTFKNSKIGEIAYYGEGSPGPKGTIMTIVFEIEGQEFMALNGGPEFTFSQAISFYVKCKDQAEIDELWDKLSVGGEIQQCGWLKDKYGIAWQIIPPILGEMLQDKDPKKAQRVMEAMLKMIKIDIQKLKDAYDNK
jgi:predicted 3-demethylubiquinone-9 3-methyltransferase (glyoxalase superfamily)